MINSELTNYINKNQNSIIKKLNEKKIDEQQIQENKYKLINQENNNNNKIIANLQEEFKTLQQRLTNISNGEYLINLKEKIKDNQEQIKKVKKEIKSLTLETDRLSKNLNTIQKNNNIPEKLKVSYKQEEELAIFRKKNKGIEERLRQIESEYEQNKETSEKLEQKLEKIK